LRLEVLNPDNGMREFNMQPMRRNITLIMTLLIASCGGVQEDQNERTNDLMAKRRNKRFDTRSGSIFGQSNQTQSGRTPSAQPVAALKYPIIFHHGFMGGTGMGMNEPAAKVLTSKGNKVFRTQVSPAHSIAYRAKQLAKQIDEILQSTGQEKVNIIGHSMGGLDSRYLISTLGYHDRVASLTTIATPHRGTPLADHFVNDRNQNRILNVFTALISKGINSSSNLNNNDIYEALSNLQPDHMINTFNPQNPDHEAVYYQSYAGVSGGDSKDRLTLFLRIPHRMIAKTHGPNDGVVPLSSAKWTNFKGALPADHIDTSGFRDMSQTVFNYENFIVSLTRDLKERGY